MKPYKNKRALIAGFAVFTILLVAYNAVVFYQDSLGDDFWGGQEAPLLRVPGTTETNAHWFFDVSAGKLKCPKFIGANETKTIGLELVNSSNEDQTAIVHAFFSAPHEAEGLKGSFSEYKVPPKSSLQASWQVGPENLGPDRTVRARIYSGNKAGNAYGETRLCTVRYMQFGSIGGNLAGFGLIALLLAGFWIFWCALNRSLDIPRMNRSDRDAWRVFAVVLTLVTFANLLSSGLGLRIVNLFAILIVAIFVLRPTETLHRAN